MNWPSRIRLCCGLALVQAIGWLYIHTLFQYLLFRGRHQVGEGHDFGLTTFVPGFIWALLWGLLVFRTLSRRLIGVPSTAGYLLGSLIAVPVSVPLVFYLDPFPPPVRAAHHMSADVLSALFKIIGIWILPEGRHYWAGAHMVTFIVMFIFSFSGAYLTEARVMRPK